MAAAPHVIMGKSVEVRRSINDDGTSTAHERRSAGRARCCEVGEEWYGILGKGAGAPRNYDDYGSGLVLSHVVRT